MGQYTHMGQNTDTAVITSTYVRMYVYTAKTLLSQVHTYVCAYMQRRHCNHKYICMYIVVLCMHACMYIVHILDYH